MAYKVAFSPSAKRVFDKLPRNVQGRLAGVIDDLSLQPRPHQSLKLTGHDLYRIRSGDYRVVYSIDDDMLVILVVKIGHRREIYR
jgi:mRNA interferase RelE/StbE